MDAGNAIDTSNASDLGGISDASNANDASDADTASDARGLNVLNKSLYIDLLINLLHNTRTFLNSKLHFPKIS